MRLFLAVAADDKARAAAAAVVARLRRVPGDYRWVDPRDMHLTLRYLGAAGPGALEQARALLREAAAASAPFELVYGGVGAFDSIENARVIWVGVEKGQAPMEALARRLGFDEPRPYSPHLTLGRWRRGPIPSEFAAALRAEPRWGLRQTVTRLSLYASRPASFGHTYEIYEDAELAG